MRKLLMILSMAFFIIACDKNELENDFSAEYEGTFTRTTASNSLENTVSSNVTLHFTDKRFSGSSSMNRYPAICSGSFTISQAKINVQNECVFTADFDWTYIFKGEYDYELAGDDLKIWRNYPDGSKDRYLLKKIK